MDVIQMDVMNGYRDKARQRGRAPKSILSRMVLMPGDLDLQL